MDDQAQHLRDRYFALRRSEDAEPGGPAALWAELEEVERPALTRLAGLELSACPTRRFRQLRFVEARHIPSKFHAHFARPSPALPELLGVFVDPHELGFHCFENLVCLDRLFADIGRRPLRFNELRELAPGVMALRGRPTRALRGRLEGLDDLELYLPPPNPGSRGGRRYIFHAAALAKALSTALRWALPKEFCADFVGVNPVFRCNRFAPGDAPFTAHHDAPYSDPARGHYSTHTLLLQLRAGRGEGVLRFGDGLQVDRVEAYEAFVFDQRRVHGGAPFVEGDKIFLRSELIFTREGLERDARIGAAFAKAIYLSAEELFEPQLAAYTHAAYERASTAHWRGPQATKAEVEPVFRKRFRGHAFLTNGYDYWFVREAGLDLREAAAIALLDVLNAKLEGGSFRGQCSSEQLLAPAAGGFDADWAATQLAAPDGEIGEPAFATLDLPTWFPEPEPPQPWLSFPRSPDFDPDPYPDDWDATRHERVIGAYVKAQDYARARILPAPVVVLGQELFLNPERFVVEGNEIHVLSAERPAPVHFAGAVFYSAWDFVEIEFTSEGLQPLVPPIQFRRQGALWHLSLDLFRNDWMVSMTREQAPVPVIETEEVDTEWEPWLSAVAKLHGVNTLTMRRRFEDEKK